MITRMDNSISIIAVIYGQLNNFNRYLKIINFSKWWSFHYRHGGSSIIIPKEGFIRRYLHNGTADKDNTHSEKFPLPIPLFNSFTPRQRRPKIFLITHKCRGCILVLSINRSVEPNEEQKVSTSGFDPGITANTSKQVLVVLVTTE